MSTSISWPPVLTTVSNVTIDSSHQVEIVGVVEEGEFNVKVSDDKGPIVTLPRCQIEAKIADAGEDSAGVGEDKIIAHLIYIGFPEVERFAPGRFSRTDAFTGEGVDEPIRRDTHGAKRDTTGSPVNFSCDSTKKDHSARSAEAG